MSVETLLINGPSQSGKTTVARLVADHAIERKPHYLRMRLATDGHTNAVLDGTLADLLVAQTNGWASVHEVSYTGDRVFETLPEGLRAVRREDRNAFVILEADPDPSLRHAYPYDFRLFVMPAPDRVGRVFRAPADAAAALQQVMQDTASFASEIFGLFDMAGLDDSVGVIYKEPSGNPRDSEQVETLDVEESQLRQFLNSPLGAEIASRIQLQPDYHALVEADVVVINTGLGKVADEFDPCIQRIEKLLARIRHDARRRSVLYWGDIQDTTNPSHRRLIRRLKSLFSV